MEQTLKALQDLQVKAFAKGIHSFDITARRLEDGSSFGIYVTIFLKGDDTDEDYFSKTFYRPSKYGIAEIAELIGEKYDV